MARLNFRTLSWDFRGLSNSYAETAIDPRYASAALNTSVDRGVLEGSRRFTQIGARASASASDVGYGLGYGKFTGNEIQRILASGSWTSGSIALIWDIGGSEFVTDPIDYDSTASEIQTALEAETAIDVGDVRVRGGALNVAEVFVEGRGQYANTDLNLMTWCEVVVISNGGATSGTFTFKVGANTATAAIAYNASAATFQSALDAVLGVNKCTVAGNAGGPWTIILHGSNVRATNHTFTIVDSTAGGSGVVVNSQLPSGVSISITEHRKGGTHEQYVAVVKHSGSSQANLYKITSADSWATTTWTSLASDLHASEWHFAQYFDTIYGVNATDGFLAIPLGGSIVQSTALPTEPQVLPTYSETKSANQTTGLDFTGLAITESGMGGSPTIAGGTGGMITITPDAASGTESGVSVVLTVPITSTSLQFNDRVTLRWGLAQGTARSDIEIDNFSFKVEFVNAASTSIEPDIVLAVTENSEVLLGGHKHFHLSDKQRNDRKTVTSIKIKFTLTKSTASKKFFVQLYLGDNWINDYAAPSAAGPIPAKIEYAYSYFNASTGYESKLSQVLATNEVPSDTHTASFGSFNRLTLTGATGLTTSDKIYIYRKEKNTGLWRRLQNADGSYGVANVASGTTTFDDHWMEHELSVFPELSAQVPSVLVGLSLDQIGAWKECLVVGGLKQAWISRRGRANTFGESPDDADPQAAEALKLGPYRPVTEYVSNNRSEEIRGFVGADALYVTTDQGTYAKLADLASQEVGFRRLLGARGALTKRATAPFRGGILVGASNGLFYYEATPALGSDSTLRPIEEELTKDVRASWRRLIGPSFKCAISGATPTAIAFTVNVNGDAQGTGLLDPSISEQEIREALEGLSNVSPGDVDVIKYGTLGSDGVVLIRTGGAFADLTSNELNITISFTSEGGGGGLNNTATRGGSADLIVAEYNDELWIFNGAAYMMRSQIGEWTEGTLTDTRIEAVVALRSNGLMALTEAGKLIKFKPSQATDNGTAVKWYYRSGRILFSSPAKVHQVRAFVRGAPYVSYTVDRKAGGADGVVTITTDDDRATPILGSASANTNGGLPGMSLQITAHGVVGTDYIERLEVDVEGGGSEYGH